MSSERDTCYRNEAIECVLMAQSTEAKFTKYLVSIFAPLSGMVSNIV